MYVVPFTNLHSLVKFFQLIHTIPTQQPPPSLMLPISHCGYGSDGCVWSAAADSSELCKVFVTGDANKQRLTLCYV